jgi:hypothetical protein
MRKPLIYSAAIHAVIVVATIVALPAPKLDPMANRVLPVELLTVADVTNLKRLAKKVPQKPKPIEQPTPPKPEPEKPKPKLEPVPEPKAEPEKPAPEEKAEPIPDKKAEAPKPEEKKPEPPKPEKKKPAPEKKPEKKKKAFDPNNIAALLNKMPDASSEPAEAQEAEEDINVEDQDDPTMPMTVSEVDAVRQKVQKCWNAGNLAGGIDADKMFARLSFELAEDGSVVGTPDIERTGPGASRLLAEYARKAIVECAPYDMLPRSKWRNWKDVTANFDLSGMM